MVVTPGRALLQLFERNPQYKMAGAVLNARGSWFHQPMPAQG